MNKVYEQALSVRKPAHPVAEFLLGRWSPRAMTGESITDDELMTLFDAARFAPSSFNEQPWRFIYAKRDTPEWNKLFALMGEFNQKWTKNAAVLMVIVSHNTFKKNDKPNMNHSFDTGSAWMALALQAAHMGLVAHGMAGFDAEKAKQDLGVPDGYSVEAMCAVGHLADKSTLPEDMQKQESPSDRNDIESFAMHGVWSRV